MQYTNDLSLYNMDAMTDEQFNILRLTLKSQCEAKIAEQRLLEKERLAKEKAEAKEQHRIRLENIKLKKEAEDREMREAEEHLQREAEAAKERAVREAEQKIAQAKLDDERKKREALEAEQRAELAKVEAERQRQDEEKRQSLLAPDKEKLLTLAATVEATELPALASKNAQSVLNRVEKLLIEVSTYIRGNVKGL